MRGGKKSDRDRWFGLENEKTSISSDAGGIGKGRKNRVAGTSRAVTRRNESSKSGPTALVGM